MRYFISFSYCGSNYQGSQSQPNATTVQGELERAFALILRQPTPIVMAGRTDAGVHAEQMWAHVDLPDTFPTEHLVFRLNGILPADIALQRIVPVCECAHARFDALSRTYEYRITMQKDPFHIGTRTRVRRGLDFERMNRAANSLIGKQDFQSFSRTKTDVKTFLCTITQAYWRIERTDTEGNVLEATFIITANRFLRNMVRAIVGTLFEIGYGKRTVEDMETVIAAHDRSAAGDSAPASGLFLTHIAYPSSIFLPITTK